MIASVQPHKGMTVSAVFFARSAKDYIKKLEKDRFEADLKEAQEAIAHMGSRLHSLETGNDESLVVELDEESIQSIPPGFVRLGPCSCRYGF